MNLTENNIEQFIRDNKDKFPKYEPKSNHDEHFLIKLSRRFKKFVSIVPPLIRVLIVTILIWAASGIIWYKYFRHPIVDSVVKKVEVLK